MLDFPFLLDLWSSLLAFGIADASITLFSPTRSFQFVPLVDREAFVGLDTEEGEVEVMGSHVSPCVKRTDIATMCQLFRVILHMLYSLAVGVGSTVGNDITLKGQCSEVVITSMSEYHQLNTQFNMIPSLSLLVQFSESALLGCFSLSHTFLLCCLALFVVDALMLFERISQSRIEGYIPCSTTSGTHR